MRYALALVLLGCGTPWTVVVQSGPPSAIAGAGQLTYAADFNQSILDGQPVGTLLAAETPDEQANIQAAFQQMDQEFLGSFTSRANAAVTPAVGPPQPNEVRLTAIYENIQRGARGPIGSPTRVIVRFSISVGGQVTDEVQMSRAISPSITRSSVARRLHAIGRQLGDDAGKFFNSEQTRQ